MAGCSVFRKVGESIGQYMVSGFFLEGDVTIINILTFKRVIGCPHTCTVNLKKDYLEYPRSFREALGYQSALHRTIPGSPGHHNHG